MNTTDAVLKTENTIYHTDLIRKLAEMGKTSVIKNHFEVVQDFLKTVCKATEAETASVYQYAETGFQQKYKYDAISGPVYDLEPVILKKEEFIRWIHDFQKQDSVIIAEKKDMPEPDFRAYERVCGRQIHTMIAFRLTQGEELSGCMILENPNMKVSASFIELIPLIDAFLGNVRKNYQNETDRKQSQTIIDENRTELEKERQFLEVLSRDYTTVYHLDLLKDTLEPLKITKEANATRIETLQMRKRINYTQYMKVYCEKYVASRNREEVLKIMKPSVLYKKLSRNSRFVYRYESTPNKSGARYFEVQIVRINEKNFDGNALMAFRHIDDIITQEQKQHQELEAALEKEKISNEILSALGKIYYAIFRINLDKDIYEEISSEEEVHHLTGKRGCASEEMMEICRTFVVLEYQERIRNFFNLHTLDERLKDDETIAQEYLAKDGNWHTARFIVKRRNADGHVTHVLYVTQLISDTKRREQNWISIAEDANRANEAKSEFISQIAHDIRTPMNAIFGFLDIAEANIGNQEKLQYCLKKIRVAGDFMKELVNDVLDISRMEHGKMKMHPEPVGLSELIAEFPEAMKHSSIPKNLKFNSKIHDIVHDRIIVDPLRIKQIYSNVLSNAVKYTPDGGSIDFEIYEEEIPDKPKVCVVAVISDTGIGMSEDYMDKMYGKFTRETDTRINKVSGYGLGLSIVRQLVDMMEGSIHVKSKVGEGTSFCIRLELPYTEAVNEEKEEKKMVSDAACEGMHLLVAEDNDLNYEVISELLSMHKITCERAEDGVVCIEKFERSKPYAFDGILMDMQMPNMDGVEATRNIRKLNRTDAMTIPIIAMTANAFKEDIQKCIDAGMNEHLSKPVDIGRLLAVLGSYRRK